MAKCGTAVRFLAWVVNRTPAARDQLTNWNRTVQFSLSGEGSFYVTFADRRMSYKLGRAPSAELEFISKSKDFFDVMTGKTKFDQAFSNGTFRVHGSITDAVRLMRVAEVAFELHPTLTKMMKATSRALA